MLQTYFGLCNISLIAALNNSSVKVSNGTSTAYPLATAAPMFIFWSPNTGMPTTGTPWYTDSVVLKRPPCVIKALILG